MKKRMGKAKETVLEINLAHLTHNYRYLRSKLAAKTKFMAVVKAAGYGSDANVVANHLQKIGVDYFAVAYVSEGIILRESGITASILVLHPQPVNFLKLIEFSLEATIYSLRVLREFILVSEEKKLVSYPIQLKFNTGLNRIGFEKEEIPEIIRLLQATKSIKVKAIFSHLAASEDPQEKDFTIGQLKKFKEITTTLVAVLGYIPILHQSNTSGILKYPEAHFDMVRSGIGLYGYGNDAEYDRYLKPISSLKSIISQIHILQPGDSVGYNRAFIADSVIKTATIPIGHADGIGRRYGNKKGFVTIQNQKAYILGNVCMDMIMVDVTTIDCKEGDEVIVFDKTISAVTIAERANTISYELLTAISPRVKRIVIEDFSINKKPAP